jgi:hypothetical protein
MNFFQGQSVRIIHPNSSFHNQIGTITNIIDILGSTNNYGVNITVRLDQSGEDIYINQFSNITIIPNIDTSNQ